MIEVKLIDQSENEFHLRGSEGEPLFELLLKHHVPPTSVIVTADDEYVSDFHRLASGKQYRAELIEGYGLARILDLYASPGNVDDAAYVDRYLGFDEKGGIVERKNAFSIDDVAESVEETIRETIVHYDLLSEGDTMLVGLSGGVDSSSLVLALSSLRPRLFDFEVVTMTLEERWASDESVPLAHARELTDELGLKHHVVGLEQAEGIFDLDRSIGAIMSELEESEYSPLVPAIEDAVNQRLLEAHAESIGVDTIATGAHATELIAGLLSTYTTGAAPAPGAPPRREVGNLSYIYPLTYVTKKELYLYHHVRTGESAKQTETNPWEWIAQEQGFYYYLADMLQTYWPTVQYWLIESYNQRPWSREDQEYVRCDNCGKIKYEGDVFSSKSDLCRVCSIFSELGYVND